MASHLSHSEKSLFVRVDLLVAEVSVESSDGNDGDHTEGGASIGDAVVLGGWLELNGFGSEGEGREDWSDSHGIVDLMESITDIIEKGQGILFEVVLHLVSVLSLKILKSLLEFLFL